MTSTKYSNRGRLVGTRKRGNNGQATGLRVSVYYASQRMARNQKAASKSGRIPMCGVTPGNIDYLAQAIFDAVTKFQ